MIKRQRRAAFKKWQFSLSLTDSINHNRLCALFKRTVKKKKIEDIVKFSESIDFGTDPNYVWNKCKILKNKWTKPTKLSTTHHLQTQEHSDIALDKIGPPWTQTNPFNLPTCQDNEFLNCQFTFFEFNIALDEKNLNSAPGMDGIHFQILQSLPVKFKLILLDIFNEMLLTSGFPEN